MEKNIKSIAKELKDKLRAVAPVKTVKLYGSRARTDYDEYSDMDIFVEVDYLTDEIKDSLHEVAWEVGFRKHIVITLLIFTRDELTNSPLRSSPIVRNIELEGITI